MSEKLMSSDFFFDKYKINKFNFTHKKSDSKKVNFVASLEKTEFKKTNKSKDSQKGTLTVGFKIVGKNDKTEEVSIYIEATGYFSAKFEDEEKFERFCKFNGLINLLNVIRSYIISVTSQTGHPTVIMPLINIPASLK
ncbi:hypothetical protein [Marinitoga aeolica]|uniref:Preprotein translocase subunit SecB n=1 Tax=Marinitoga aeolica TaxID=2809031 RepID=A0ABY8PPT9_9BACT|nr:hypothetical protein [Marinitoga aeolica]WGS64654.1 hypothetical protein JRV97_09850 [Marinitoga aeolica]